MTDNVVFIEWNGQKSFRVTIEPHTLTFEAKVEEVTGWDIDSKDHHKLTPCDFELCLSVMIKRDGCSHFRFGSEGDGYLHLCGVEDFEKYSNLISELYILAMRHLDSGQTG